jgi:hypothetical protein
VNAPDCHGLEPSEMNVVTWSLGRIIRSDIVQLDTDWILADSDWILFDSVTLR